MNLLKTRASFLPFTHLSLAATMSTLRNSFAPKTITFPHQGEHIAGHLFLPENYDPNRRYPAAVVGGALSTVKEMMAGTYAEQLSRRGVIGLAIDYRNYGQSGGALRQREDPESKVEDLSVAAAFLKRRGDVAGVGLLGICTSGGNVLKPGASDPNVKAIAVVAGFLQSASLARMLYGGEEAMQRRRAEGQEAMRVYDETGEIKLLRTYGGAAEESVNPGAKPYYEDATRGNVPQWRNEFAMASWQKWVDWDPVADAAGVRVPTLMVHSERAAFPDQVRKVYEGLGCEKEIVWLEGAHYDFYDEVETVNAAADRVARHFHAYLG